jgi:hypothetical protein
MPPLIITPSTYEVGVACEFEIELYVLQGAADAITLTALPLPTLETMQREGIPLYEDESDAIATDDSGDAEQTSALPEQQQQVAQPDVPEPSSTASQQEQVVQQATGPPLLPRDDEPPPTAATAATASSGPPPPPSLTTTATKSSPPPPPPARTTDTSASASVGTTGGDTMMVGIFGGVKLRRVDRATLEAPKPRINPSLPFNFEKIVARRLAMQDSDEEDHADDGDDDDW